MIKKSIVCIIILLTLLVNFLPVKANSATSDLDLALRNQNIDKAKSIIKNNPSLANSVIADYNATTLHIATFVNFKDIIQFLIDYGADVNAKDCFGQTPLHCAARESNKEIADLLISNGANLDAVDEDGKTPLDYAEQNGDNELIFFFLHVVQPPDFIISD